MNLEGTNNNKIIIDVADSLKNKGVKLVQGQRVHVKATSFGLVIDNYEDSNEDIKLGASSPDFYFGVIERVLDNGLYEVNLEGTNNNKIIIDLADSLKNKGVKLVQGQRVHVKATSF